MVMLPAQLDELPDHTARTTGPVVFLTAG